jgi:hypothetical protein
MRKALKPICLSSSDAALPRHCVVCSRLCHMAGPMCCATPLGSLTVPIAGFSSSNLLVFSVRGALLECTCNWKVLEAANRRVIECSYAVQAGEAI